MAAAATGFEIVGREAELARLGQFVDEVGDGRSGAVIRGEAGMGKTVLWRAAVEEAKTAGIRVLSTQCAQTEMPLALGSLGDLLDGALAQVSNELAEPQRDALALALGLELPTDRTPDRLALPRAFLVCIRALADRSAVLVAIDDVQWLDLPSQRVLAFAARRLGSAPVAFLTTQRDAGDILDLRRDFDERLTEIHVGPLSRGALHHLIRTRLGVRIPKPMLARVHTASGGNPLFAIEYARVPQPASGPLPVPSSLEELIHDRVAALPPQVLLLLAAVAAAERPTVALAEAAMDDAATALDAASAAGAVSLGTDGVIRSSHPLLASAAYAALSPSARRALHARLAVANRGAEDRARHLALATFEPDEEVATLLDEAAERAGSRGAPEAAAALARHAIRLTPPDDVFELQERALAVATYLTDSGQMTSAQAVLGELLAGPLAGRRRAQALLLAFLCEPDLERAQTLAEEALENAGDDPVLRARILLTLGTYPVQRGDFASAEILVREALELAEGLDDPTVLSAALMCAGNLAEIRRQPEPWLLERAIEVADSSPPLKGFLSPRLVLAQHRLSAGDLPGARQLLATELDATRRRGDEQLAGIVRGSLFELEWQEGNWEAAEGHLEVLWELVFDGDNPFGEAVARWRQAQLAAGRGDIEEARRHAHAAVRLGEDFHLDVLVERAHGVLGFLALAAGAPEDAWEELRDVLTMPDDVGAQRWHQAPIIADAVEAAVGVGRLDDAALILEMLENYASAGDDRWARPAALRCGALLMLARAESDAALTAAEEAAAGFEAAGFPLDRGRALLVAGDALRRLGERRRAARHLEAAKEIFADLGASLWHARAERELRRAMPRPRRDGDLTDAERRVAALVASGRTNREVAAQLFTTVGTTEVHLTRIYRKLGVRSRTELARVVADGTLDLSGG